MELFFQEKFSLKGKVVVTDMNEKPVFVGERGVFFNDYKTYLYDAAAEGKKKVKIATILQNDSLLNKGYTIKVGKKKVAKLKKKLSLVNQNFKVKGLNWDVKGNFIAREYTITKGDEVIAVIKRAKLLSLLEGYSVTITNDNDAVTVACVVLVLNRILNDKKNKLFKK